eukprot:COSAG06_NODE_185_length_20838_cov_50.259463_19_plen_282_part_00
MQIHFYTRLGCATFHTHFALSLSVRLSLPIFIQRVLDQTPWYHAVVEPCKRPSMPWTVAGFVISAEPTRPSEWSWGGVPARATACTTKRAHHKDATLARWPAPLGRGLDRLRVLVRLRLLEAHELRLAVSSRLLSVCIGGFALERLLDLIACQNEQRAVMLPLRIGKIVVIDFSSGAPPRTLESHPLVLSSSLLFVALEDARHYTLLRCHAMAVNLCLALLGCVGALRVERRHRSREPFVIDRFVTGENAPALLPCWLPRNALTTFALPMLPSAPPLAELG